ncbi:hypothetical protein TIFTF001_009307 [Ficus carica]|uniref:Uncharacterized protein n=1 Tax=Ficus carica TaxID=3494 RepID=A0AA87ZMW1_FICCA|nr:hypothetical protein TIFTF001_009307 [Ficus carica]
MKLKENNTSRNTQVYVAVQKSTQRGEQALEKVGHVLLDRNLKNLFIIVSDYSSIARCCNVKCNRMFKFDCSKGISSAISREAKKFELGETKYYVVLVWSAIIWQGFFLGAIGVIFCASSLLSGIVISVLLPVTEILAVIFYQESFQAQKGVSLALSLWGFVSYFYGEFKHDKKNKKNKKEHNPDQETEMPQIQNSPTTERYSLNP